MAGSCKPSIDGLRCESSYKVLSLSASQGSGGTVDNCGLFNGISVNEWNTKNVFYWYSDSNYLEIEIYDDCNIWRSGTTRWKSSSSFLTVHKFNKTTGEYEDITASITQTTTHITDNQWEIWIAELPSGRYKFIGGYGGLRLDSEWYLEVIDKTLIKYNNKYYSIKQEHYNTNTKMYNELQITTNDELNEQSFSAVDLITAVTIDGETFRPIDKFDKFQIVSLNERGVEVKALKSNMELIISNQNLSTINAEIIHNFMLDINKVANGDIKLVISNDNGNTWQTWDGTDWISLINTCPLKRYSQLSDSEKIQWEKLKNEVWSSGISTDTTGIDYNIILTNKTIRFAFVLYRPTCEDNIFLTRTNWLYDKIGAWHKLSEDDIDIAINSNSCVVTPKLQNLENVKVNILI